MAQHGYLRDYDEGWDRGDGADRWHDEDRGRSGPASERNFMLRERDRGFAGSRFGDGERPPRNFRSRQDDHYLSWRDKQMDALDRDYADYCREREAQFHQDFENWRSHRHGNPEPLRTGMTQTGLSADPTGELQLTSDDEVDPESGPDPTATATLGTSGGR